MRALVGGSVRERAFNAHALRMAEKRRWRRLESILGVRWDAQTIQNLASMGGGGTGGLTPEEKEAEIQRWRDGVLVPLSLLLSQSDFVKELAKRAPAEAMGDGTAALPVAMGEYAVTEKDGELVSMGKMGKEDFFRLLGAAGIFPGAQMHRRPTEGDGGQVDSERAAEREALDTPLDRGPKRDFKRNMQQGLGGAYEVDPKDARNPKK